MFLLSPGQKKRLLNIFQLLNNVDLIIFVLAQKKNLTIHKISVHRKENGLRLIILILKTFAYFFYHNIYNSERI